jgi:hypothetical protein
MENKFTIGLAVLVLALAIGISDGVTTPPQDLTTNDPEGVSPPQADLGKEPIRGYWNYTENGEYCILCAMAIRLTFTYEGEDRDLYTVSYDVPANNTFDGTGADLQGSSCDLFDRDIQRLNNRLRINFFEDDWILELDFFYDYDPTDGDREWYMADIDLYYTYSNKYFPALADTVNIKQRATLDRIAFFFTDLRTSYRCDSQQELRETDKFQFYPQDDQSPPGPVPQRFRITTWQMQLEAFARASDATFHPSNRCAEDEFIPRLVPGIVGGIVAASIIAALSLFTIQRKAKGRDYGSGMYIEQEKKVESSSAKH